MVPSSRIHVNLAFLCRLGTNMPVKAWWAVPTESMWSAKDQEWSKEAQSTRNRYPRGFLSSFIAVPVVTVVVASLAAALLVAYQYFRSFDAVLDALRILAGHTGTRIQKSISRMRDALRRLFGSSQVDREGEA